LYFLTFQAIDFSKFVREIAKKSGDKKNPHGFPLLFSETESLTGSVLGDPKK